MPFEILEKIFALAIPNSVTICSITQYPAWQKPWRFWWEPSWVKHLLLVSKRVGYVVRKILSQRFWLNFVSHKVCNDDLIRASVVAQGKSWDYFENLFAKEE
jgi:hypothetical protein